MKKQPNIISRWLTNARAGSFVQSFMPAMVAAVFAIGLEGFRAWMAFLAILGVVLAHLAMNLADDWFDYRVDMKGDRDRVIRQGFRAMTSKYPYLEDGSETLRSTAGAIAVMTLLACICGAAIFIARTATAGFAGAEGSWWIVAIVAACGFLGAFYSAPPFKLGYHGLGELVIGFIFGPLLMCGVYYSACGKMDAGIAAISIPVGLLVLNILFTHSFIDMDGDAASNKMTFARLLGSKKACLVASFLINLLPFAAIVAAVCLGKLSAWYLLVLLDLPRALWLCDSLIKFTKRQPGVPDVPEKPLPWLGGMSKDWNAVRAAGIDWFLMRWFCARNILSGFCLLLIVAKLIQLIF